MVRNYLLDVEIDRLELVTLIIPFEPSTPKDNTNQYQQVPTKQDKLPTSLDKKYLAQPCRKLGQEKDDLEY